MKKYIDHHNDNYKGIERLYNGIDDNAYAFERARYAFEIALRNLEK